MGKSTTAQMFRDENVPVWDADGAVHQMYSKGGMAVGPIGALRPQAIIDAAVDRAALKEWIAEDATALRQIEALVHPLLAKDREAFLRETKADIVVLDFPLLFETGAEKLVDQVLVVSVPAKVQRDRLLARKTMTSALLETILAAQMPDAEKRARADVVIITQTLDEARRAVRNLLKDIREGRVHA